MTHVKRSWSTIAAVASVLGIAACGGQQQPQPNTASSAQDQLPELYGSRAPAETQGTTMRQGDENPSGLPSTAPTTTSNPNEGSSSQAGGQAGAPYGANSQYGANTPYGSATMNGPNGNVSPTGVNDTSPRGQTGGAGTTT
ncbi:MAG: hypothetical protein JOZ69_11715, partial [Myxococcales bacterium]|nr:hypothetical protein [Myxococcales bacterium]